MKDLHARLLEPWTLVGYVGQALFFGRFLIQWIASERRRRSVIPLSFWWFSIGGALLLLAYSLHRLDPVFILGQTTGLLVYSRNLLLPRSASTSL
jgi:lipid-A-disaccharide synthase-like uncharacterized protein